MFKAIFTIALALLTIIATVDGYHYKRVCVYDRKSQSRRGIGKCLPEHLNSDYCTHLVYAHALIKNNRIRASQPEVDDTTITSKGMFERFNDLKKSNQHMFTMLSVGGPDFSSEQVTTFLSNIESRREFIRTCTHYLRERNFDGLDIDFRYPGLSDVVDHEYDRHRFSLFLQELHSRLRHEKQVTGMNQLILSVSVSGIRKIMETAYDYKTVASSVDFINIKTFDFHTAKDGRTGLNSPLHSRQSESESQQQRNVEYAAYLWHKKASVAKRKLIIGMPMYGRTFQLESADFHGIDHKTVGPGKPGSYTKKKGILSYYEICKNYLVEHSGSPVTGVWNTDHKSPFLYTNTSWISYDDRSSLKAKVEWLRNKGFGGWIAWSIDMDDFSGRFCDAKHRKFPLLEILNKATYSKYDGYGDFFGSKQELKIYENTLCSGKKDGIFRSSHSCRKFYKCYKEKSTLFICPEKLIFDKKNSRCEFENKMTRKELRKCRHHEINDISQAGLNNIKSQNNQEDKLSSNLIDALNSRYSNHKAHNLLGLKDALKAYNRSLSQSRKHSSHSSHSSTINKSPLSHLEDEDELDIDLSKLPHSGRSCSTSAHASSQVYSTDPRCRSYSKCSRGVEISYECPAKQLYDGRKSDCSPQTNLSLDYVKKCLAGRMDFKIKPKQ